MSFLRLDCNFQFDHILLLAWVKGASYHVVSYPAIDTQMEKKWGRPRSTVIEPLSPTIKRELNLPTRSLDTASLSLALRWLQPDTLITACKGHWFRGIQLILAQSLTQRECEITNVCFGTLSFRAICYEAIQLRTVVYNYISQSWVSGAQEEKKSHDWNTIWSHCNNRSWQMSQSLKPRLCYLLIFPPAPRIMHSLQQILNKSLNKYCQVFVLTAKISHLCPVHDFEHPHISWPSTHL